MVNENLDMIFITEAWISERYFSDSLAEYELTGYHMFLQQRDYSLGGGILVYVKQNIKCHIVENIKNSCLVESIWLDILLHKGEKLRLGVFYRPPGISEQVDLEIQNEINKGVTGRTIIIGDFNITGLACHGQPLRKSDIYLTNCFQNNFMFQLVRDPTRGDEILDLILSNNLNIVREIDVGESLGNSDHAIVRFSIISSIASRDNNSFVPNFSHANFDHFRHYLANISWNLVFDGLDTNEMWEKFKNIVFEGQNRYIPSKLIRKDKPKRPPWLSNSIKQLIRRKQLTYKRFKQLSSDENLEAYRKIRDDVKKCIRKTKRRREIDLANNCKGNAKKFFSFYKFKTTSRSVGPLEVNGKILSEDKDIVQVLSEQFSSVFTKENVGTIRFTPLFQRNKVENLEITEDKIKSLLKEIKPNKAAGPDDLYARVLKECYEQIAVPLTYIFKRSLEFAEVPKDWRNANVVPIFKKGSRKKPSNYRPASLTSVVCKILEKIIKDKIQLYLDE